MKADLSVVVVFHGAQNKTELLLFLDRGLGGHAHTSLPGWQRTTLGGSPYMQLSRSSIERRPKGVHVGYPAPKYLLAISAFTSARLSAGQALNVCAEHHVSIPSSGGKRSLQLL